MYIATRKICTLHAAEETRLIAASDYKVVFHALLNHTQLWHCAHSHPSHFLVLGSWNEKNLGVAPSHAGNGKKRWKCHELL